MDEEAGFNNVSVFQGDVGFTTGESVGKDPERIFEVWLVERLATDLRVPYEAKHLFIGLLRTCLGKGGEDTLWRRLRQYYNAELEQLAATVAKELGVSPHVDANYAPHAKFDTMLKEWKGYGKTANP